MKQGKIAKVMREYASGALHSGSPRGPKVTDLSQAKAIAMSEARKASGGNALRREMAKRVG